MFGGVPLKKKKFPLYFGVADVLSAYTREEASSSAVFLVWAFVSMRNRSNWELTSIHGYRNVLRLLTSFIIEPRYFMRFSKNAKSTKRGKRFAKLTDKQRVFVKKVSKVRAKQKVCPNVIKLLFNAAGKVVKFKFPKVLMMLKSVRIAVRQGNRFTFSNYRTLPPFQNRLITLIPFVHLQTVIDLTELVSRSLHRTRKTV